MEDNRWNESQSGFDQNSSGTGSYGTYSYGRDSGSTYQSAYQNSSRSFDERPKKRGGGAKVALAVLLAVIFGVCAGAGAFTASRFLGRAADSTGASKERTVRTVPKTDLIGQNFTQDKEETAEEEETAEAAAEEQEAAAIDLELMTGEEVKTQITEVVDHVMPSIVSVYNNFTYQGQTFFGQTYSRESTSTGSGIIIAQTDDELLVVTNNHVVAGEDTLEVQFIDETTANALIKGTDPANDLAVIAVKLEDLSDETLDAIAIAILGDSEALKVGEPVVAIGNALGYGQSVTAGVVSALNRQFEASDESTSVYIQTDAAINPGNSGGALVDMNGHVVGINSAKTAATQVEGMCYAIPMSRAVDIIENLANQDTKVRVDAEKQGYLGIRGVSVTSQVSAAYDMPVGVYVAELIEGGGAADSDLEKGDIIVSINKTGVTSMEELQTQLTYYEAGETVTVGIKRQSGNNEYEDMDVEITLGALPETEESSQQQAQPRPDDGGEQSPYGGYGSWGEYLFPWIQW